MRSFRFLARAAAAALAVLAVPVAAMTRAPAPPVPHDLLGCSPETILATYGLACEHWTSSSAFSLSYKDKNGALGTFLFHGDAAVQVPPDSFVPAAVVPPKPGEPFPAQRAADAARCLGNPKSSTAGTSSIELEYPDGRKVTLAHGRVFF
ncbi:MAG TPA: hypothetical protein VFZ65_12985 [Planctomycetota bacterium]|nr:hypothetical protein [Planctomycetota bacterium]